MDLGEVNLGSDEDEDEMRREVEAEEALKLEQQIRALQLEERNKKLKKDHKLVLNEIREILSNKSSEYESNPQRRDSTLLDEEVLRKLRTAEALHYI